MSEELLVNVSPAQTRVAIIEQGILREIHIESVDKHSIVGNIYKGKIVRVLPGLQSAFVDIGLDRTAFLHIDDLVASENHSTIEQSIIPGQVLLVQVTQDPIGSKGARLTAKLSLSSRNLVMLPNSKNISVSQNISDHAERERLKLLLKNGIDCSDYGFIIRTVAEGTQDLEQDKLYLLQVWKNIKEKDFQSKPSSLVHIELSLILRVVRDIANADTKYIRVDSPDLFVELKKYVNDVIPGLDCSVELHMDKLPLFSAYKIDEQINQALQRKVSLKCGGYLIIDQNEALTTVDVNTGAFVGRNDSESTLLTTNMEAAGEIARQLRLRNIGGIIIIDFINMQNAISREQVLNILKTELSRDSIKTVISPTSPLGLVQLTRKRIRESLLQSLCDVCPTCSGRGYVKNND